MKALSIDPEYTNYIYEGTKTIECRTWKTNYRGKLLICATKTNVPGFISGHAYCVADLTDIEPFTEAHLEASQMDEMPDVPCYAWHLENIKAIYPIPVRGKQGLFDVDDSKIKYMENEHTAHMTADEFDLYTGKFYIAYLFPLIYMPGENNEAYYKCIDLGKEYREHPEMLLSGDPIPEELLGDPEEE